MQILQMFRQKNCTPFSECPTFRVQFRKWERIYSLLIILPDDTLLEADRFLSWSF